MGWGRIVAEPSAGFNHQSRVFAIFLLREVAVQATTQRLRVSAAQRRLLPWPDCSTSVIDTGGRAPGTLGMN